MKVTDSDYKHRRREFHTYDELTSTFEKRQAIIRANQRDGFPKDFMLTQVGRFAPCYMKP